MRVCCQSGKLFDVIFCIRGDGVTEEHLENVFLISVRFEMPMLFKYLKVTGPLLLHLFYWKYRNRGFSRCSLKHK